MPGGTTYGIGCLFPFSSILTAATSIVELSKPGLFKVGSAMTFVGDRSELNRRHSPLTNCNLAILRIDVSAKFVMNIRIKRIDLKSWGSPALDSYCVIGMRS